MPRPTFLKRLRGTGAALGAALAFCSLLSCSASDILLVHTDRPELALLAERYQAQEGKPVVRVEYRENLLQSLRAQEVPDLIIGKDLNSEAFLSQFRDIAPFLEKYKSGFSDFYSFAFLPEGDQRKLLVLSFNLPVIASRIAPSSKDFFEGISLDLEQLKEKSLQNNREKKGTLSALGFSPLYDDNFLYLVSEYLNAGFSGDSAGFPNWNEAAVSAAINYLRQWIDRNNRGFDEESRFLQKFAYAPQLQLLYSGTFAYVYLSLEEFFSQDSLANPDTSIYWPTYNGTLRILDDFTSAGIPKKASNPGAAEDFLLWLAQDEVQEDYLSRFIEGGFEGFGFLGGLSSKRGISEDFLPRYYPKLRAKIPSESILKFPARSAILWTGYKTEVLKAYFLEALNKGTSDLGELKERTRRFYLQLGLLP